MNPVDLVWTIVGFLLTVLVLSYVFLGDNPLFRIATYAFIGVAAGYAVLVTFTQVIWPKFFVAALLPGLSATDKVLLLVPGVLSLLLLTKLSPRMARVGNISMAFLVGTGAAVVIGGAVLGTILPQGSAAANQFDLGAGAGSPALIFLDALVALVGTIGALFYFYYSARPGLSQVPERSRPIEIAAQIGQVFIAITLGAVFAGVYSSALTALIERLLSIFTSSYQVTLMANPNSPPEIPAGSRYRIGAIPAHALRYCRRPLHVRGPGTALTTGAPFRDISEGLRLAIEDLEKITGRVLIGKDERLILPDSPTAAGSMRSSRRCQPVAKYPSLQPDCSTTSPSRAPGGWQAALTLAWQRASGVTTGGTPKPKSMPSSRPTRTW